MGIGVAGWPILPHDQAVTAAVRILAVGIEPEYLQIRMSVVGSAPDEPGAWPDWPDDTGGAVSGSSAVLVATWSDDNDPVAVEVYLGRPALDGWTHVHTAQLLVGTDGLAVGMTVSAMEHTVSTRQGLTAVEVWVKPKDWPSEVTFALGN